jgi:hypothetical protein
LLSSFSSIFGFRLPYCIALPIGHSDLKTRLKKSNVSITNTNNGRFAAMLRVGFAVLVMAIAGTTPALATSE